MVTLMFPSVNVGKDRNEDEKQVVRVHSRLVCVEPPRIDYPYITLWHSLTV